MTEKKNLFANDSATGKEIMTWWEELNDDRASRAILKRCNTPLEVVMTAPYQRLYQRLRSTDLKEDRESGRLPAIIGLLAHVKTHINKALPELFSDGDPLPLHPLRFRRLLESSDHDDLYTGLRRALPLIEYKAPILGLARDVFFWGDRVKRNWVYDYRWPSKSV